MYIGTSVYERDDYEFTVTNPSGTVTTYNVTQTGNGCIQTRAQEVAGPKPLNSAGYAPITINADTEGIYIVTFYGFYTNSSNFRIYNSQWVSWPQHNIAAWDITVVSQNGNKIDGRVFFPQITFSSSSNVYQNYTVSFIFYVLTNNGYQYSIMVNNADPVNYIVSASNIGNMINNHSAYSSYGSTSYFSTFLRTDFVPQSNGGVMYRLFYNKPDSALLSYLGLPSDGNPIIPSISNLKFTSSSGKTNALYANEGGTFTFDSVTNGEKYILTLDFGNGNEVKKYGSAASSNSISWDGKDGNGDYAQPGNFSAALELLPGEVHFVLGDFEFIPNGIVIQRLNGSSSDRYKVYYNHTPQTIDGRHNGMDTANISEKVSYATSNGWVVNSDDTSVQYVTAPLDGTNGVSSSSGISKTANLWSDEKQLDFWTFDDTVASLNVSVFVNEKINIQVNKRWEDDNNRDGMRPSKISVKLLQNNVVYDTAVITGSTGNTWTYTFRNLPKYNTDGELFAYSVEESNE